jgi:hypothetical protein
VLLQVFVVAFSGFFVVLRKYFKIFISDFVCCDGAGHGYPRSVFAAFRSEFFTLAVAGRGSSKATIITIL